MHHLPPAIHRHKRKEARIDRFGLGLGSSIIHMARSHELINTGWKFHQGDPEGLAFDIRYDSFANDGEHPIKIGSKPDLVLKPWVLPSGNSFVADKAKWAMIPTQEPPAISFTQANFSDRDWRTVNLPHDWAIEGPFIPRGNYGGMGRLKSWGAVWYRRDLDLSRNDAGRSIFLDIDGAMSYATVWLNGKIVGGWPYGYASFRLDLTKFAQFGKTNKLAIRLDNPPDSARWYPGAGIYRNVWLTKTSPLHVAYNGTHVSTSNVSKDSATVDLSVTVQNESNVNEGLSVSTNLYAIDSEGKKIGGSVGHLDSNDVQVRSHGQVEAKSTVTISNPRLWGPLPQQTPNRYVAVTTLLRDGTIVDRYETNFGIRRLEFDGNQGVLVNGQKIPLNGVNNHHDLGAIGSAFNVRAAERQLEMLQEMGCNSIRMSHNPPAPELLELTDRMGFLVLDEIFDCWQMKKTPYDFHFIFDDWHEADLRSFMRRDRNHPSVIVWSVGNEVGEQFQGDAGAKVSRMLVDIAHEEDQTRPVMTAMNWSKSDMALPTTVDIITLNYQGIGIRTLPGQFRAFHQKFPDKVILSSESAAALSSRGEYQFPVPGVPSAAVRPGIGGDGKHVSAYELFAADFGTSADKVFLENELNPYVAGEFVWTGWDYLGEPTPYYDARSSYFGIIDLAGFKKDRFYLYQSRWRPDLPMAHILPHWNWPGREGQTTPVHVFTTGDEAELFVNGKSQGRKKRAPYEYRFRWDYVSYEPGEVSVVTYKNGKEWAKDSVRTAGDPARIELKVDRSKIAGDGLDLAFVTAEVVDAKGVVVPNASNRIRFSVTGSGELVATDNGDPTELETFSNRDRKAFNGKCLAIVRGRAKGQLTVKATGIGLGETSIQVDLSGL